MSSSLLISLIVVISCNWCALYVRIWLWRQIMQSHLSFFQVVWQGSLAVLWSWLTIRWWAISSLIGKASIEEGTKLISSESIYHHRLPSDHIGSAIMAWIWFALVENIIYLRYIDESIIITSITRIIINTIAHALFTGLIWFGIYKSIKSMNLWLKILYITSWIIASIMAHSIFNRSLTQHIILIPLLISCSWYIIISYLLFKTDSLYLNHSLS